MPKTDAEWRALDERLAREVMGWHKHLFWWSLDESGCPVSVHLIPDWQPHKNVAQAIEVADMLIDQHPDMRYTLQRDPRLYWCFFHFSPEWSTVRYVGFECTLAEAICLAAEQWANAQKEVQDDPG